MPKVSRFLRILGFSRSFSQCIFASATETLGKQVVVIEVAFAVSVGVHAGALCEYMFADDRLVGRNTHAGVGLDDPAYLIDFFLVDSGRAFELVVYHGNTLESGAFPARSPNPLIVQCMPCIPAFTAE